MSDLADIREAIQQVAMPRGGAQFQVQHGTVKDVDWNSRTCTVTTDEEYDVPNVRLRAVNDGNQYGPCFKPAVGSDVLIAVIYNKPLNAYVCMFSQIDTVSLVDANGTEIYSVDVANGDFVFNGGNNGAMVIIQNLVDKINRLENNLTGLANYLGGLPIPVSGAVSGPAVPANTQPFAINQVTQVSDLANNKVKH